EAVLRERLNALELPELDAALGWTDGGTLPGRIAAFAMSGAKAARAERDDALLAKLRPARAELARLLADWLAGVRCRADLKSALRERSALAVGECFVTRDGHVVSAQGVTFFAPDSELHGVLARHRELAELEGELAAARRETRGAAATRDALARELEAQQQQYHDESMAFSSQQRRCHDLELELLQIRQAAEAAEKRRAAIAEEISAMAGEEQAERAAQGAIDG